MNTKMVNGMFPAEQAVNKALAGKMQVLRETVKTVGADVIKEARIERKAIAEATAKDPLGTSYKAARGGFNYSANNKINDVMMKATAEINAKHAQEAYNATIVKASMIK